MTPRLPWPRYAEDGHTPLGIDLACYRINPRTLQRLPIPVAEEVRKLVAATVARRAAPLDVEEVAQETLLEIWKKNISPSAYDPRRAGFTTYVSLLASNVIGDMLLVHRRHQRAVLHDELPEVVDDHDAVGAYEDAQASGHPIAWVRAHVAEMVGPEDVEEHGEQSQVRCRPTVEQLGLFGSTAS